MLISTHPHMQSQVHALTGMRAAGDEKAPVSPAPPLTTALNSASLPWPLSSPQHERHMGQHRDYTGMAQPSPANSCPASFLQPEPLLAQARTSWLRTEQLGGAKESRTDLFAAGQAFWRFRSGRTQATGPARTILWAIDSDGPGGGRLVLAHLVQEVDGLPNQKHLQRMCPSPLPHHLSTHCRHFPPPHITHPPLSPHEPTRAFAESVSGPSREHRRLVSHTAGLGSMCSPAEGPQTLPGVAPEDNLRSEP